MNVEFWADKQHVVCQFFFFFIKQTGADDLKKIAGPGMRAWAFPFFILFFFFFSINTFFMSFLKYFLINTPPMSFFRLI